MITLRLLFAFGLFILPCWVWLARLLPHSIPARGLLLSGYTLLLGLVSVTLIMKLLTALGIEFSLLSIGTACVLLWSLGLALPDRYRLQMPYPVVPLYGEKESCWARALFLLCLALIVSRLIALGIEVGTRPVFSWDAKQHWAKQAKVFYELGRVIPYVPLQEWLDVGGKGVYTNMHPDYPTTTPLLQAWSAIAVGQWHDSLVNTPWLAMYVAMGLTFYAQTRIAGVDKITALVGTYMVLSLPYLNTHVALAGYADLMVAALFLGSVGAFANWCMSRHPGQLAIALLCGASCILVKNEGFYWFLSLIPGLALATLGLQRGVTTILILMSMVLAAIWLIPENLVIAGHSLEGISLQYRPQSWAAIFQSFFLDSNWHFLSYLIITALVLVFFTKNARQALVPVAGVILSTLSLYLALYLLTKNAHGAVHFTSLNRVALQLMPAMGFFTLLVYSALLQNSESVKQERQISARPKIAE